MVMCWHLWLHVWLLRSCCLVCGLLPDDLELPSWTSELQTTGFQLKAVGVRKHKNKKQDPQIPSLNQEVLEPYNYDLNKTN